MTVKKGVPRLFGAIIGGLLLASAWAIAGPASPAHACVNPASYYLQAHPPALAPVPSVGVDTKGSVSVYGDTCADYLRVLGQRKVCGFWGCNYEDKASSGWVSVGTSSYVERTPRQSCISGTHRYQTRSEYEYSVFNGGGNKERASTTSNREFSC